MRIYPFLAFSILQSSSITGCFNYPNTLTQHNHFLHVSLLVLTYIQYLPVSYSYIHISMEYGLTSYSHTKLKHSTN